MNRPTKHPRYQDYVIKDGRFVGEFEEMYKDFDDPWEQTTRELWASEKAVGLNLIQKFGAGRVIEVGCGFGHYTKRISDLGVDVLGVDISETAINKAKSLHREVGFSVGDFLDFDLYCEYRPDVIVMAEITWYILDKIDDFLRLLRERLPNTFLIHLLTTYPAGVQQYGRDKFTNLDEIKRYFDMQYLEWGEISYPEMNGCKRTYFIAKQK